MAEATETTRKRSQVADVDRSLYDFKKMVRQAHALGKIHRFQHVSGQLPDAGRHLCDRPADLIKDRIAFCSYLS